MPREAGFKKPRLSLEETKPSDVNRLAEEPRTLSSQADREFGSQGPLPGGERLRDEEDVVMPENLTATQRAEDERWEDLQRIAESSAQAYEENSGVHSLEKNGRAKHFLQKLLNKHKNQLWLVEGILRHEKPADTENIEKMLAEKALRERENVEEYEDYMDLPQKRRKSIAAVALLEDLLLSMKENKSLSQEAKDFLNQEINKLRRMAEEASKELEMIDFSDPFLQDDPRLLERLQHRKEKLVDSKTDLEEQVMALEGILDGKEKTA